MAGVISIGGLASGLDTNRIIDQLVELERRPITLLEDQITALRATQASFGTLESKLAALRTAADALNTTGEVLVGKASSSNESAVTAAAGTGASRGTMTLTVTQLAQGSVAGSTTGVAAATDVIATGPGTFAFQVGAGDVRTVALTGTTTLEGLADAVNDLNAGVSASAVNLGTPDAPDWRLNLVTRDTGASSTITVVQDDTTLAVQTTQAGQNAQFGVSGFSGTFERATNTFADVLPGVTFSLKSAGTAVVTVSEDPDAIVEKVGKLVTAFNDIVTFVAGESTVAPGEDGEAAERGALSGSTTVRRVIDQMHAIFSQALAGATTRFVNLSSLGMATQRDGTIAFDESKLRAALGEDATAAAQVFAGNEAGGGVANGLSKLVADLTGIGGTLAIENDGFASEISLLQDQIDVGQRRVDAFEEDLKRQFNALENLVSGLQSQANFLLSALGIQ